MLNITRLLTSAFVERLRLGYRQNFAGDAMDHEEFIASAATDALASIASSDALYHDVEHTIHVTLVGQAILRGKHMREGTVTCSQWLQVIIALLCHDIGYVRGICREDGDGVYATGDGGHVSLGAESTDASLMAYHVDRGKLYVREHFGGLPEVDIEAIRKNIELTRFPIPADEARPDTSDYPCLVRAADLIGQLSDPRYLKKIPALFYEFEETGFNRTTGYRSPADLLAHYPSFYWETVYPYIPDALRYLSVNQEGQQIVNNLYANLYMAEKLKGPPTRVLG
jgi:hypothetical protein